ncbi:MAG: FtsP/CotA-like multicopper oxidase with cupredoxin domain [Hyphomicrobiaceae bacterium]|jgi:FtsP/CotA-like multicopper oxidase with cupredoxin domain
MITRREFQFGSLSAAGVALLGTAPQRVQASTAHIVSPKPATAQLLDAPEPVTNIWGYRGLVPGPLLEVTQGQQLSVDLVNGLPQPTTIHWHGIRIDNAMDGVAYLTQQPAIPEETFAYRFAPPDAGTYWYHPHNRTWEQMARGLYGMLIVREPQPPAVDRDVPLVFDDWRLGNDGQIDTRSFGAIHDKAHGGRMGNVLTLNGKPSDDIEVLAGDRVRLRLLNAANARIMGLQFVGHAPVVIALDGQPVAPFAPDGNVILLAPSQRADVILDMTAATGTSSKILALTQREKIHLGNIVYNSQKRRRAKPLTDAVVLPPNPMPTELDLKNAITTDLVMTGGAMGAFPMARYQGKDYAVRDLVREHGKVWAFNGEAGMTEEPLAKYQRGQTVKIRMINQTAWPHAMHFHGHHVREVAHSKRAPLPHWRDTVLMLPREEITIAFVAHNPGKWMCHCHMLEHQAGGMATWFEVS